MNKGTCMDPVGRNWKTEKCLVFKTGNLLTFLHFLNAKNMLTKSMKDVSIGNDFIRTCRKC